MIRDSRLQAWILPLLCATLLVGRVAGAHLHLCFDGMEPAKEFHVADLGLHHSEESAGAGAPHQDTDVAAIGDLIGKPAKPLFDLPLFLLTFLSLWLLLQPRSSLAPALRPRFTPASFFFLRPPLRGPPLTTSR